MWRGEASGPGRGGRMMGHHRDGRCSGLGFRAVQNLGRQALSRWNAGLWSAWASPESCPPLTSCFPLLWVPSLCPRPRRRPTLTSRASQLGYPGPEAAATGSWVGWRDHRSRLGSFCSSLNRSGHSPAPPSVAAHSSLLPLFTRDVCQALFVGLLSSGLLQLFLAHFECPSVSGRVISAQNSFLI